MRTVVLLIFVFLSYYTFAGDFHSRNLLNSNSGNYDIVYHRISITVNPAISGAIIAGSVTTYFKTTVANVSSIQFDLDGAMTVSSASYHGSGIGFSQNIPSASLTLTIPNISVTGTLDSVTVFYSGTPSGPSTSIPSGYNYGVHNGSQKAIYTLDESFTGHMWWPCKESLYDKIDSVDLIVTAPNTYKVAGNGTVTEIPSGGNLITTWKTRYPIATYGINFAVANYQNYQYTVSTGSVNLPVMNYFYPEDNTASYHTLADTLRSMIPYYVSLLNTDYPFLNEKYGLNECYGNWGALEVQTMTFMAQGAYDGYIIAHELSHQWFGDMLTANSWHQIWLNEGFAQYFQSVIYPEHFLSPATLASQRSSLKSSVNSSSTTYVTDTTNVDNIFFDPSSGNSQPYNKGAMLLSMLRTWLGDTNFFTALHNYVNAPGLKYNFTSVDSLEKYMQAQTPLNLTNFFSDWVYKKGFANYIVSWNPGIKKIVIQLQQSPSSSGQGYFDMPVPIHITGTGLDTTVIIIDKRGVLYNNISGITSGNNTISFNLSANPTAISLDPANLVLANATSIGINTTLAVNEINFSGTAAEDRNILKWTIKSDDKLKSIFLEKASDGINFLPIGSFAALETETNIYSGNYTEKHSKGDQYYRLKIIREDNSFIYSAVCKIKTANFKQLQIFPDPSSGFVTVNMPENFNAGQARLSIHNTAGQVLKRLDLQGHSDQIIISITSFKPGTYELDIINNSGEHMHSTFIKL